MAEDELTEFVEKEIARPGATKRSVREALDRQAKLWERQARSRGGSRAEKRELVERAGRILHYFFHGYVGGDATTDDRRLVALIDNLPRG